VKRPVEHVCDLSAIADGVDRRPQLIVKLGH